MKRGSVLILATLLVFLVVSVCFLNIPIIASQDNTTEAQRRLRELRDEVSDPNLLPHDAFKDPQSAKGNRESLANKIDAVVHQVEAGAINDAINKLENDLTNAVTSWVTEEYADDLIDKINYIIDILKAIEPQPPRPKIEIVSVLRVPETPNYDEDVTIIAQVESKISPIDKVVLSYSFNAVDWINVTMNLSEALYTAVVPHQPYQTIVSYKVYANDTAGRTGVSEAYSYVVVDSRAPTISDVERSLVSPNYNDTVTVAASVTEPADASGVKPNGVLLSFTASSVQTNVTMRLEGGKYKGVIGELPFGTLVEYRVLASDEAGNWAVSDEASYTVGDEYPPIIKIISPAPNSFLKDVVNVVVFAHDDNFDKMELKIGDTTVNTWTTAGTQIYEWKTEEIYKDGPHTVSLIAYDKAGNSRQVQVNVTVDNTAPTIDVPSWTPRTPSAQENVSVTVKITDNPMGSGVKNATLWYRNDTGTDWRPILMIAKDGNWTATIPGQSGNSTIEFYIEAADNAGNHEKGEVYDFTPTKPLGFPLWLLLLIILIILAATGATIYWVRYGATRRTKKSEGEVVPSTRALAAWLQRREDHPTVSFIVPTYNQEGRIANCISSLFQCAGEYPAASEVLVVDDGSSDHTYEAARETIEKNRRRWPRVKGRVIRHTSNLGRAAAVHTGVTAATRELICVFDPTRGWSPPS